MIVMVVIGRKASKKSLTEKKLQVLERISDVQRVMRERKSSTVRLKWWAEARSCKSVLGK